MKRRAALSIILGILTVLAASFAVGSATYYAQNPPVVERIALTDGDTIHIPYNGEHRIYIYDTALPQPDRLNIDFYNPANARRNSITWLLPPEGNIWHEDGVYRRLVWIFQFFPLNAGDYSISLWPPQDGDVVLVTEILWIENARRGWVAISVMLSAVSAIGFAISLACIRKGKLDA